MLTRFNTVVSRLRSRVSLMKSGLSANVPELRNELAASQSAHAELKVSHIALESDYNTVLSSLEGFADELDMFWDSLTPKAPEAPVALPAAVPAVPEVVEEVEVVEEEVVEEEAELPAN